MNDIIEKLDEISELYFKKPASSENNKRFKANIDFIKSRLRDMNKEMSITKCINESLSSQFKESTQHKQKDMKSIYKVIKILIDEVIGDE